LSKTKGRRTQNKAIEYLQEQGYLVDTVEKTGRFRKYKDLYSSVCVSCFLSRGEDDCCKNPDPFEGFDIIGIKPDETVYVQIKTNSPATQRTFKKFAKRYAGPHLRVFCYTWYDRDGFRIQEYLPTGKIKETDLRKSSTK